MEQLIWENKSNEQKLRVRFDVFVSEKNNSYLCRITNRKQENGMVESSILITTSYGKIDMRQVFDSVESAKSWTVDTISSIEKMFDGLNGTEEMELTAKLVKQYR